MDNPKPKIRSSSLPQFMVCSNSILNPDGLLRVETENEAATLGTLVHAVCQKLVDTGSIEIESLRGRVTEEDFERASMQFRNFTQVWHEAMNYMVNPRTEWGFEVELSHAIITGHIDVYHIDPLRAFVIDYKTGRQHEDHYHQLAAYAFGVWDKAGRPSNFLVYASAVYLEDRAVHSHEFTADALKEWEKEVAVQVLAQRYTAGRKCAGCSLQDSCPAWLNYARNMKSVLLGLAEAPPEWDALLPVERGHIIDAMYVLDKALDRVRLSLRNTVKSKGSMAVGDGKEMAMIETKERQLNTGKAWTILSKRVGLGTLKSLSRVPLESVLAAYAAKAAKGQKTAARKELLEELDAAQAIVRNVSTKMFRRPVGELTLEVKQ